MIPRISLVVQVGILKEVDLHFQALGTYVSDFVYSGTSFLCSAAVVKKCITAVLTSLSLAYPAIFLMFIQGGRWLIALPTRRLPTKTHTPTLRKCTRAGAALAFEGNGGGRGEGSAIRCAVVCLISPATVMVGSGHCFMYTTSHGEHGFQAFCNFVCVVVRRVGLCLPLSPICFSQASFTLLDAVRFGLPRSSCGVEREHFRAR